MGVNFLVDKAATQETAAALNAALAADTAKIEDQSSQSRKPLEKLSKQELLGALLEGKTGKLDVKLLSNLAQSLAVSGIKLSPKKMAKQVKGENFLVFGQEENFEDKIDLRSSALKVYKQKDPTKQNSRQQQEFMQNLPEELKEAIPKYAEQYAKFLAGGGEKVAKEIKKLEKDLQAKGLNNKDLKALQIKIKNSVRTKVVSHIRDKYVARLLTPDNGIDSIVKDRALDEVLEYAVANDKLGGEDFGGHSKNLEGAVEQVVKDTRKDVKEFLRQEMTGKMLEQKLTGQENLEDKDIQQLLKLGFKVGFDFNDFSKDLKTTLNDLGATALPANFNPSDANSNSNSEKQRDYSEYEMKEEDEKNVLMANLVAIYRQRALGGPWARVKTAFRMRRMKNGLVKLGLNFDHFKKLERQGKEEAFARLVDGLNRLLEERATLFKLTGPDYGLLKDKIKVMRRNIDKLGAEVGKKLSEEKFTSMIDQANRLIFDQAMQEYHSLKGYIKLHPKSIRAEDKLRKIVKTLEKLSQESHIPLNLEQVSHPQASDLV